MKIAFLGSVSSFNYYRIGGTDSITRKLSHALVKCKLAKVDNVLYGASHDHEDKHVVGLRTLY